MKTIPTKDEMRKMSAKELKGLADEMSQELFKVRLDVKSGKLRDYSLISKLKKAIARALTFATQKEREGE